jgi:hypothetical protein
MDKAELLHRIATERQRLFDAIARVPPEQFAVPILYDKWSAKDLIAHVGWWEIHASSRLETLQSGELPENTIDDTTVDEINEGVYQAYLDEPLENIREMAQAAYDHLVKQIEDSPNDDLFNPQRFAWLEGEPFLEVIAADTYEHYPVHLNDLVPILAAKGY